MTALSGKSAKDLESMTKDQLKQACGDSEGSRVFSQFAVQKANWEVDKNSVDFVLTLLTSVARKAISFCTRTP